MFEHAHGGNALGAGVMNGHVNDDTATASSVQSRWRGQRRRASSLRNRGAPSSRPKRTAATALRAAPGRGRHPHAGALPPMICTAVLSVITPAVAGAPSSPGGIAGAGPRRNHAGTPSTAGFRGWVAAVEPKGRSAPKYLRTALQPAAHVGPGNPQSGGRQSRGDALLPAPVPSAHRGISGGRALCRCLTRGPGDGATGRLRPCRRGPPRSNRHPGIGPGITVARLIRLMGLISGAGASPTETRSGGADRDR